MGWFVAATIFCSPIQILSQAPQVIPGSWAYPLGAEDSTQPGFAGRIHQARQNAELTATIARANSQLAGNLIDPTTGESYTTSHQVCRFIASPHSRYGTS